MREIDANNSEVRLTGALRSLADASAAGAPREIGEALAGAFRRHHARRRALRRTAWAGTVCVMLVAIAVWLSAKRPAHPTVARTPRPAVVPATASPTAVSPAIETTDVPVASFAGQQTRIRKLRPAMAVRKATQAQDNDFVVLSSYNQPVRGEELRIIRLEVTGTALRRVGAPVMEQKQDRKVLADFVVGQDGTPYAVRLVRSTYSR